MAGSYRFALYNIHRIHPFLTRKAAPGPSAHHLPPRLLQLAPGWTPCLCDQTFAAYPERCSTPSVQPIKIPPFTNPCLKNVLSHTHIYIVSACSVLYAFAQGWCWCKQYTLYSSQLNIICPPILFVASHTYSSVWR